MYLLYYAFPILLFANSLFASPKAYIEGRAGAFYFQDHLPRSIYGNTTLDLEAEGGLFFKDKIAVWANFNYNFASGSSLELFHKTHLTLLSLSVGPKFYMFGIDRRLFNPYLGIGVAGTFLKTSDHSPYVEKHLHRYRFAGVAKSGFLICKNSICIDLFFDYYICNSQGLASAVKNPVNIGGFKTGLGMGYLF